MLHRSIVKILLAALIFLAATTDLHAEKRIGVIMTGDISYYRAIHQTFVSELDRRSGGLENIEIILQRPFPNPISWSNAARKLIAFDVDLIVTYGSPATEAALHEKSSIPMIYAGFYEPDAVDINPRNITGCGYKVPLSSILRYFKRLKNFQTLGIVYSGLEEDSVRQFKTIELLCQEQNIAIEKIDIRSRADLDGLQKIDADGVFLTGSSLAHVMLDDIMATLENKKIPVADIFPDNTETGILMTLYQPSASQGEMVADMAWRILGGTKPSEIGTIIFRETELVFNLIEARHLGIDFPIQLLIEATRVIE